MMPQTAGAAAAARQPMQRIAMRNPRMRSLVGAVVLAAVVVAPALAQVSPQFSNPKIVLFEHDKGDGGYWTTTLANPNDPDKSKQVEQPMNPDRKPVRDSMMARRILEDYAEFLSPLRLPRTLRLFASDCKGNTWDSPYYDRDPFHRWMNLCYSFIADAEKKAEYLVQNQAKMKLWTPVSREQLRAGLFAATLLHEAGHAVFDLMDVPVFGREEDAADQMAAFIALQFGKANARTVIKGFAYFWGYEAIVDKADPGAVVIDPSDPRYPKDDPNLRCFVDAFCAFSDEHGTASQRMYNVLCLAYGGDPAGFQDLVDSHWLPADRARNCESEYQQVYFAFSKTVFPFIDPVQMKKVQARQWFDPQETKEK
jgi:hypothetical protein